MNSHGRYARATLLSVLAAVGAPLPAQQAPRDPHAVQPERPTVATHAGTVAPGWLELEVGAQADRFDDGSHAQEFPIVAKIGLVPRVQLNLFETLTRPEGTSAPLLNDFAVGIKWRVIEGSPVIGNLALLPSVKLPTASPSSGAGTGTTDASILVISSRSVGPVALDLNFGYTRRSGDGTVAPREATVWTVSLGGPLKGRLGWVAEAYGYPATSGVAGAPGRTAVLAGPTLMLRSWLVVDAGVILPVTGSQPKALYAGGTYNVGRLWEVGRR